MTDAVSTAGSAGARRRLLIGVVVHTDVAALHATLGAVDDARDRDDRVVLVPDGPDVAMAVALRTDPRLMAMVQVPVEAPLGHAAAFNRLAAVLSPADGAVVLLENGSRPAPDALVRLAQALDRGGVGIAGPSTNDAWNEQCALPTGCGDAAGLRRGAAALTARFGDEVTSLAPLHSIAEMCIAVSVETLASIGAADEGFRLGPCWEMEYAARAARVGRAAVWVRAAYVHRGPPTRRRLAAEADAFVASRQRYQDRLCDLRLSGARSGYAAHCEGDTCVHFAPASRIVVRLPLPGGPPARPVDATVARAVAPPPVGRTAATDAPPCAAPHPTSTSSRPLRTASVRLVSCLMPTADRSDWAAQAIEYFHRQDHPAKQLVIVDDGAIPLSSDLGAALEHPSIVYLHEPRRRSIGDKRNIASARATGEILMHWDDDDWYGPGRITAQVAPLLSGAADITALRDAVWFDVASWGFRRPAPAEHRRLFVEDVHGGTLAFTRSVWERGTRYPDLSLAEDAWFLRQAVRRGARLIALPSDGSYLYVRHGTNSWRMHPELGHAGGWVEVDEPATLCRDRPFYAARSANPPPLEPDLSQLEPPAPPPGAALRCVAESEVRHVRDRAGVRVSCIMPTADRRRFVPAAVAAFRAQRETGAELLIVDDGDDPVEDLVPDDPLVRYLRLDRRRTIGEKRNLAVAGARGEIIVHFDDDDWSHPDRLGAQVGALRAGHADVCGLSTMLWWDPQRPAAWRYTCPPVRRPWVAGNTLAYLRATWERSPFPAQSMGEDTAFVWGRRDRRVVALDDERLVIGTLHGANTSTKHTTGSAWSPVAVDEVRRIVEGRDVPAGRR
ncbi:MAG: putative glycosyltransferase [Ilumatobacteraceae bacterium]|nr:putative glycosyltransferase [Ilumatobacteraceae bacterium]